MTMTRECLIAAVNAIGLDERRRAYSIARRWMQANGVEILPLDKDADCANWTNVMLTVVVAANAGNPVVLGIADQ